MASSVNKEDIKELREAGYLAKGIVHRLPAMGQILPTPEPHERVVFLTHFVRVLGFPLHPFVRGLMFYYGLDFHDLAPNSILSFSAFIVVCEAFLRITQLWIMAEDLQCEAKGGGWSTRRVRRRYGEQAVQRHMAHRYFRGGRQSVATTVVLHHRAP